MSELIDRQALDRAFTQLRFDSDGKLAHWGDRKDWCLHGSEVEKLISDAPTIPASPWHRVEDGLPKEAGEYIVAYHPCWWNDVKTSVTEIGIDTFRGKTSWAKRKFQRVTHWMEKPEPPKEDA